MVVNEAKCTNGEEVKFEETPYYFKLTIGGKTWYWDRDTGQYDGVSYKEGNQLTPCSFSQSLAPFSVLAPPTSNI